MHLSKKASQKTNKKVVQVFIQFILNHCNFIEIDTYEDEELNTEEDRLEKLLKDGLLNDEEVEIEKSVNLSINSQLYIVF